MYLPLILDLRCVGFKKCCDYLLLLCFSCFYALISADYEGNELIWKLLVQCKNLVVKLPQLLYNNYKPVSCNFLWAISSATIFAIEYADISFELVLIHIMMIKTLCLRIFIILWLLSLYQISLHLLQVKLLLHIFPPRLW